MSALQIIAIVILSIGALIACGFALAFIVVSSKKKEDETVVVQEQSEEVSEIDLDLMLAKLEEATRNNKKEETPVQEKTEVEIVSDSEPTEVEIQEVQEYVETNNESAVEEVAIEESPVEEAVVSEVVEESQEEGAVDLETVVEESKEESIVPETVVEEPKEEPVAQEVVESANIEDSIEESLIEEEAEEGQDDEAVTDEETAIEEVENIQPVEIQEQKSEPEFDYRVRIAKIKESQAKIDRDLEKTTRAIVKYERTIRRKERNQKMLDRRALELTNLNLLMYSVTDIKNVDAEKKTRQEELTAHISELKASIQDAENYIEANKEKHDSNLKLRSYLAHEKVRYADEIKELEDLIASGKYFDDQGSQE